MDAQEAFFYDQKAFDDSLKHLIDSASREQAAAEHKSPAPKRLEVEPVHKEDFVAEDDPTPSPFHKHAIIHEPKRLQGAPASDEDSGSDVALVRSASSKYFTIRGHSQEPERFKTPVGSNGDFGSGVEHDSYVHSSRKPFLEPATASINAQAHARPVACARVSGLTWETAMERLMERAEHEARLIKLVDSLADSLADDSSEGSPIPPSDLALPDVPASPDASAYNSPLCPIEGLFVSEAERNQIMSLPGIEREYLLADRKDEILERALNLQIQTSLARSGPLQKRKAKRKASAANLNNMSWKRKAPAHAFDFGRPSANPHNAQSDSTSPGRASEVLESMEKFQPPKGPARDRRTWQTLGNTVQRQWDSRKDDLDYELLLSNRRNERVRNVDRYVPKSALTTKKQSYFPLDRLPEENKKEIFSMVLVKRDGPILMDYSWLRPFVKGHARIPNAKETIQHQGLTYVLPVEWNKLERDVKLLESDMRGFQQALVTRGDKTKKFRSPALGLTPGLLRVSRSNYETAAGIFYGENTFSFPCDTSAWMQLETFLNTIGPKNAAALQHLRIHVPMWHRGIREDFVEGRMLDLMSPATRMAVVNPPPKDRLLSAIRHSVHKLLKANLVSLSFELENGFAADCWTKRHVNDKRLISMADVEEFVHRKRTGVALLNQLSDMVAAKVGVPYLSLFRPSKDSPPETREFVKRLPDLEAEAAKYGWEVDTQLRDLR